MNENTRITLMDTPGSATAKLSECNPGALSVCYRLIVEGEEIDPDDLMGGLGNLLSLDTHGIYGSDIWLLYKDICKQSLVDMIGVLRAVQLGFANEVQLHCAIRACNDPSLGPYEFDVEGLVAQVRERLPRFGQEADKENTQ